MLFRRFENLIDVFKPSPDVAPPAGMLRFYAHYLKQVWPLMTAVLVVGFFAALIEVALFSFLGQLIDMAQATDDARTFFAEHRNELLWMAAVALVFRPLVFGLHNLLTHQAINPGLTNLIRWQNHRYVLKQSLNFFQNDFAGRIAQRVMQTGPSLRDSAMQVIDALWHVVVYAGSALYLFAAADLRLIVPLLLWIVGYSAALWYFVPRIRARSAAASAARSKVMGRVVDGYSNVATLKLFAHSREEESYAREAMQELLGKFRLQSRVITSLDFLITCMNGLLIVGTGALALWLWSEALITTGAIALALGLVHQQHGRVDHVGGQRHLRECRHRAGRHEEHRPAARCARPRGCQAAAGGAGRRALRGCAFPLRQKRRGDQRADHRHSPGREDRLGRAVRRGQVDTGQPAAAPL